MSDDTDEFPGRLLHQAALWDNAELLEDLLASDEVAHINSRDSWGRTALHAAATTYGSCCLRVLLQSGADPDIPCGPRGDYRTALHMAAEHGHLSNIALLLEHDADLLVRDHCGLTASDLAEQGEHADCMLLLRHEADAREREKLSRHSALRDACGSGDLTRVKQVIRELGRDAAAVVNMTPDGCSTLLYKASCEGHRAIVKVLVDAGAEGKLHPVTRYSPLYIAVYNGRKDVVEVLLKTFPELVRVLTVERWSPVHACCITSRAAILDLLLRYPYPDRVLNKYRDPSGQYQYRLPFNINSRDMEGQTPLYQACCVGSAKLVEILVKFRVNAEKVEVEESSQSAEEAGSQSSSQVNTVAISAAETGCSDPRNDPCTPAPSQVQAPSSSETQVKRRISDGIQALMSRLNLGREAATGSSSPSRQDGISISPVHIDMYCNNNAETALHAAVRSKQHSIASLLLSAGADPNLSMYLTAEAEQETIEQSMVFTGSSALVEACRNRDLPMIDLLLKHGARDDLCKALYVACRGTDPVIVSRLLALKAHADPDYKVHPRDSPTGCERVVPPPVAVMVNWHGHRCLQQLRVSWLLDAVQRVHSAVQLSRQLPRPPATNSALLANITRLDVSNNSLSELPECVFQLWSLRHLSAAQNKLERILIPGDSDPASTLPVLEELYLQENRLENVPPVLFGLLRLSHLDLSNNKLQQLPHQMWTSPALKELNVSLNMLQDLPLMPGDEQSESEPAVTLACAQEPDSEVTLLLTDRDGSDVDVDKKSDLASAERKKRLPRSAHPKAALPKHPAVSSLGVGRQMRSVSEERVRNPNRHLKAAASHRHRSQSRHRVLAGSSDSNSATVGLSLLSPAFLVTSTTMNADVDDHWESLRRDASPSRALHRAQMVSSALTVGKQRRELQHHSVWRGRVEISDACTTSVEVQGSCSKPSQLQSLSLAHNRFSRLPTGLSCLAVSLTRLNLAYNGLTGLASVSDFPATLRQLDVSHNRITRWPEPAAVYTRSSRLTVASRADSRRCYARNINTADGSGSDCSDSVAVRRRCAHRRHTRFDSLRSLCLADNQLTDIQLGELPDDRTAHAPIHATSAQSCRRLESPVRQMFPGLSVLDLSNNCLRTVPPSIHQLSGLSVLNISGNRDVVELPPQMGLLSRLWNLNTRGCSLQEPLKTMIESNKYKTMDVIGYLKSVLEDARPYARMKLMIVGVQGIGKTSLLEELRQEGTGTYKKRPPEHWAKRMGNKNMNLRTPSGTTLSTVGVDICDWTYEKRGRGHGSLGPVTFRTWDFGGQREYYATHQYFLSRRSIYLVVWRIPDGEKGVNNIHQWLVNIQARAPNSPVIIVGTHFDIIKDKYPASYYEDLQQMIRSRFMNLVDADKCGLPRVLDTIEVSCRTRHNIRLLCNLIYESVFSLKSPGSKERLLEQKIPATYLALEDVVGVLAAERHFQGRDPVLTGDQYRTLVGREMSGRFSLGFRDAAELNQATAFLHENGVLLHYDDATLKDLYFLDPQWLCDMLAHVVTVREINPFARNGVMRMEDLSLVFKSSTCAPADARSYVISLLDKFEVAVTWDSRTLLIPSLLPSEEMLRGGAGAAGTADVRIPVRSRGWALRKRSQSQSTLLSDDSNTAAAKSHQPSANSSDGAGCSVSRRADPAASVRRLYLMTYFPSGFWSRLVTRLLADDVIVDVIRAYFVVPRQVQQDAVLSSVLNGPAEWRCWQSGMELRYADTTLLRVRELLGYLRYTPDYRSTKLLVYQEVQWQEVQTSGGAILEITLPNEALVLKRVPPPLDTDDLTAFGIQSAVLDPNSECAAKLLSIAVEHVDTLLEDWYPTLGTRFAHTSEGRLLVTRLIPCPLCLSPVGEACHTGDDPDYHLGSHLADHEQTQHPNSDSASYGPFQQSQGPREGSVCSFEVLQAEVSSCATLALSALQPAAGIEVALTAADHSDGDSGVGPDSACSSRQASTQGHPDPSPAAPSPPPPASSPPPLPPTVYSFLVEECVLESCSCRHVSCPEHGPLLLAQIAPDTVFLDVGERYLIRPDSVQIGPMLGRGAFGFVFRASHRCRTDGRYLDVAMKMLQPSDPGNEARPSAIAAYKAARSKWDRDPLQYACKAYCTVRQELNILLTLRHPYIVPLVGLCLSPLSLVLELAPLGSLDSSLADYRRSGARLHASSMQNILLQVAKALEYLHQQHIIYRDLKSENVLVWSLPPPFRQRSAENTTAVRSSSGDSTHVKLADYGISRSTLPVGTKGFAGTEGFMAPEIMRYNGEEEYTEKVDCFSFGMFIYELVTLHQPFEGFESVKEHILEGRRPPLTARDVQCATYLLDLMVLCWSQQPRARPCASQIVSMATAPELTQLTSAVPLEQPYNVQAAVSLTNADGGGTVWVARAGSVLDVLHVSDQHHVNEYHSVALQYPAVAAAVVAADVWIGDTHGVVRAFCSETCEEIFSYSLEPDISGEPSAVQDICPLTDMDRVAISLANGRLFITRSDMVPNSPTRGEGSFVMTELGTLGPLNCLSAVFTADRTRCEVWCGQSQGAISIYTLQDQVVVSQDVINHYHPPIPSINVLKILSPEQTQVDCALEDSMWTYVHPGCVVYHWSVTERAVVNKLDCSRLVPVSESMVSMCIEDQLSPGKCQVTAMAVLDSELYLGTTWGCLLVIAAASMLPITVFRPYEEQVRSIIPLVRGWPDGGSPAPALVTLGRGYRPLLARYCTVPSDPLQEVTSRRCAFLLVWQPHGWGSR